VAEIQSEIRVVQITEGLVWHKKVFFGPCMICARQIEYGYCGKVSGYGGQCWIEKQFEGLRFLRNRDTLLLGWTPWSPVRIDKLELFVCPECRKASALCRRVIKSLPHGSVPLRRKRKAILGQI
jgi:hypothetical protein